MLRLALISLFVSSPAFAFFTAEMQVQIRRDDVHYTAPKAVTDVKDLLVRYDGSGTCFVAGAHGDYPCMVSQSTDLANEPYISMLAGDFIAMAASELTWTDTAFIPEFTALKANYSQSVVFFLTGAIDKGTARPVLVYSSGALKTSDYKTSYTGSLTRINRPE